MSPNVITLPPKGRERDVERVLRFLLNAHLGRPINVKVTVARPERSDLQNKYLWGVANKILSEHMGFSAAEVHEWLCGEYFGWVDHRLPGGRVEQRPFRTTTTDENGAADKLSDRDFWDYVEFIQRKAAEAGVFIPDPDKDYKLRRAA